VALNPQFQSQGSRKLPLGFGYIFGSGYNDLSTTAQDGSQFKRFLHGEGEWDGPEMINSYALSANGNNVIAASGIHMWSPPVRNADVLNPINPAAAQASPLEYLHFHSGAYTPIGTAIPTPDPVTGIIPNNSSQSIGPDQGYDAWFRNFPTAMPPQSMSGIAYSIWGAPGPATAYALWLAWPPPQGPQSYGSYLNSVYQTPTISGQAVWRAMRCRIFDAYGNIVSYAFTLNPAWHKVEAILRRKIRPEQPPLAALTDAEKACFNWESIVELAARNDYILPNGNPRFVGNYIFAAEATLANIMETMCRADRSFQRIDNGKIVLQGDDARASVFVATARHLVPNTLKLAKKDVSQAPNVFVPTYRDLEIPAVCKVVSGISFGGFYLSGRHIRGFRALTTSTPSPFTVGQYARLGGCSDPAWDGTYAVYIPDESNDPYPRRSAHPNVTYALMSTPDGTPIEMVTGGYLGSDDARFSQRAPTGVQHRSAQKIVAAQAPGLSAQPKLRKVFYDCGSMTFDQANRLMKFERDRQLGTDRGANWAAPIAGTLSLFYEVVDGNGIQLPDVVKQHNVITLDDWLYPEAPGDYEIVDVAFRTPRGDGGESDLHQVDLTLRAYNRNAYTDVSDDPGTYYKAVPNSSLKLTGFTPVANASWVLQATLGITNASGTLTITIPDLQIQVLGQLAPTAYPAFSVAGVPIGVPVVLYVTDPSGIGTAPTYSWAAGTTLSAAPGTGVMLVAQGTFVAP